VAHQCAYSLLAPAAADPLLPLCQREGIAVVAYRVLEGGLLSGKYTPGQPPPAGSRGADKPDWLPKLADQAALDRLRQLTDQAQAQGIPLLAHVLGRTLAAPAVVSLALGVTRPAQLEEAVAALAG
jgi:aryl-alcohol dehydrogenase-like predicted oxidoreductase